MTDHDKLVTAVLTQDVKNAATTFVDELVSSTMLAVRQDPRAYGFVTLKEHDTRVTELLEANNREVERQREAAGARFLDLHPVETWYEDVGNVLWWKAPIEEAPYCGSPNDSRFVDNYFTHWSHLPRVWLPGSETPTQPPAVDEAELPVPADRCSRCRFSVKAILGCTIEGCPVVAAKKAAA